MINRSNFYKIDKLKLSKHATKRLFERYDIHKNNLNDKDIINKIVNCKYWRKENRLDKEEYSVRTYDNTVFILVKLKNRVIRKGGKLELQNVYLVKTIIVVHENSFKYNEHSWREMFPEFKKKVKIKLIDRTIMRLAKWRKIKL